MNEVNGYAQLALPYIIKFVGALIGLFVANVLAGMTRDLVRRQLERSNFDTTLTRFFSQAARWLVLLMAVLAVLGVFGVQTTTFAAVIGGMSLAVGLAFQGTLGSFAAGVMLLVFRPFKVGDAIKAAGSVGKVEEIGLFTTTLDTADNRRIIVPNGAIFGSTIENVSHHGVRRVDVDVGCAYDADIDATRAALEAAVAEVPGQPEGKASQVFLVGLGASSVDWQVRVWTESANFWVTHEATVRAVKRSLDAARIGIPYQTIDVNLVKPDA